MTKRAEAKVGISEWLTIHYLKLSPEDKKVITTEAFDMLEREQFFEIDAGG